MACSRNSEATNNKPHAVCIPYPSQGHVSPFMQLAKLLHWRGFHITFVKTEFNHNQLIRSRGISAIEGLPGFRFETIPDGLPPCDRDATQDVPALRESTQKNCYGPLKNLLIRLDSELPPVSCVISDGVMSIGMRAAQELGILDLQFWTASACGLLGCLSFRELVNRGLLPSKEYESVLEDGTLDKLINWITAMPNIRVKDLPNYIRFKAHDPNYIMFNFMGEEAQSCLKDTSAVILNTFDVFEQRVVDEIRHKFPSEVYTIGFLALLVKCIAEDYRTLPLSGSLWKEETECVEW
ncbi:hypothetical protein V2J09_021712 [Rumex salicifolius]